MPFERPTSSKRAAAIRTIRPNAQFSVYETYSSLIWYRGGDVDGENQDKPTETEFNDAVTAWNNEYDSLAYARNRQAEYPSIADLVVALYDTDDKSAIEAKRAAVKLKYPKP